MSELPTALDRRSFLARTGGDEFTIVLSGSLRVETKDGIIDVGAGQAVIARRGVPAREIADITPLSCSR